VHRQIGADPLVLLARWRNHVQLPFPHLVEEVVAQPAALGEQRLGHLE
jgi:hypothetical protein